jgi:hypothetical protein
MRRRIRYSLLLLVLLAPIIPAQLQAQNYSILNLSDEETSAKRPFSIYRAAPSFSGLRMFIMTSNPAAVSAMLDAGSFAGQLSDLNILAQSIVPLSFGRAVTCSANAMPIYLPFKYPFPACGNRPPLFIEYFLEAPVKLGLGRDLAIGQDPDFLWLVEEI